MKPRARLEIAQLAVLGLGACITLIGSLAPVKHSYFQLGMIATLGLFIGSISWHAHRHEEVWIQGICFARKDNPRLFHFLKGLCGLLLLIIIAALAAAPLYL